MEKSTWSDEQVEQIVGNLLRTGVILATAVVLIGAVVYLSQHGGEHHDYQEFRGEPTRLKSLTGVVNDVMAGKGSGILMLGLLLLLATPVARVAFSIFAFLKQRDLLYVGVTVVVLSVLLYSIFWGM